MFDREFSQHLIAVMLKSPQHAKAIAHALNARWIKNEPLADLAQATAEYIKTFGIPPTRFVLKNELGVTSLKSPVVRRVFDLPVGDAAYVTEKFHEFARETAVVDAVKICARKANDKQYGDIVETMRKALAIGEGSAEIGTQLREFKKRSKWYSHDARRFNVVPTGFGPLDSVMRGGLGAGELGILLGDSKVGKTFMCVNLGVNALTHTSSLARSDDDTGLRVIHHTCELSETKTYMRYDKVIAGKHADLLGKSTGRFMRKLRQKVGWIIHPESNLIVKGWPNKTLKPSMIEAHADMVQMQLGWSPDLIIVDYIGEMCPEREDERRFELSALASDLRRIAIERYLSMWTPHQANKAAAKKKVTTRHDSAEDYGIIRIADAVVSMNATDEEIAEGRMRLYLAGMRDAASHVTIDCEFNFDVGYIRATDRKDPERISKGDSSDKLDKQIERANTFNRKQRRPSRVEE